MIITDSAKVILEKYLEEEKKNCLTFFVEGRGCHSQLLMDFISVEHADQINGINVMMDNNTKMILENTVLDANEAGLVIKNMSACGGCGSGNDEGCGGCGSETEGGCCGCNG